MKIRQLKSTPVYETYVGNDRFSRFDVMNISAIVRVKAMLRTEWNEGTNKLRLVRKCMCAYALEKRILPESVVSGKSWCKCQQ